MSLGMRTMACTNGTVGWRGQPAAWATRESAPSAPTTTSACNSSTRASRERSMPTRNPLPLLCSDTKRLPKETFAPFPCACSASPWNQSPAALDDQVRAIERNEGLSAVGEKFKFTDFVDDGALANLAQQRAHVAGDNQSARCGIKLFGPLKDLHRTSRSRKKRRSKET